LISRRPHSRNTTSKKISQHRSRRSLTDDTAQPGTSSLARTLGAMSPMVCAFFNVIPSSSSTQRDRNSPFSCLQVEKIFLSRLMSFFIPRNETLYLLLRGHPCHPHLEIIRRSVALLSRAAVRDMDFFFATPTWVN